MELQVSVDLYPLFFTLCLLQEWADYDEQAQESVGIYEVTHKFVKLQMYINDTQLIS